MVWQQVRNVLLGIAFTAAAAVAGRAEEADPPKAGAAAPAASAPQYRTVSVTEWVPETYQTTRTVYRTESREETYTAQRVESVPETRTRTITVYKSVPEVKTVTRNVCVMVPCEEERTVMKTVVTCKPVTKTVRHCVDKGHYECREVPCGPSFGDRLRGLFNKRKHGCCEDTCCADECAPVRTKTVRVWVPCPTWEEKTVTRMQRVCETKPVTCRVKTCKREMRQETCQVTCYKCVPEQKTETCTVMVRKCVPCQATRTVCVCVPHQEAVTCTRMVKKCVEKQVPVVDTCAAPACADTCCEKSHHRLGRLLARRNHDCCCN